MAVKCAAIPAELMQTELFGHVKGAFSGAVRDRLGAFREAQGGTLFLDEIGDMDASMQAPRAYSDRTVHALCKKMDMNTGLAGIA